MFEVFSFLTYGKSVRCFVCLRSRLRLNSEYCTVRVKIMQEYILSKCALADCISYSVTLNSLLHPWSTLSVPIGLASYSFFIPRERPKIKCVIFLMVIFLSEYLLGIFINGKICYWNFPVRERRPFSTVWSVYKARLINFQK